MNPESPRPEAPEAKKERVPTREEVLDLIREAAPGEYKETRSREDETGLYLLDLEFAGEKPGETTEYSYIRAGRYKEGGSTTTTISITFYEDSMPVGGKTYADLVDGVWVKQ
jgi:hypothetical protein